MRLITRANIDRGLYDQVAARFFVARASRSLRFSLVFMAICGSVGAAEMLRAETTLKTNAFRLADGEATKTSRPSKTNDRIAADPSLPSTGLTLASEQMPELVPLLEQLKTRAPMQYEKAIRDLDRSAKRLESIKKRDKTLHEIALREWTTQSKLQLLRAKQKVNKKQIDPKQIQRLQETMLTLQIERADREMELLQERRTTLESRLKAMRADASSKPNAAKQP